MPTDGWFQYTFESLARAMARFTEALKLERFAIYVFDYGAPVGLRVAQEHPERITAIISQNGNAYDEGLSEGWDSIKGYWSHPTAELVVPELQRRGLTRKEYAVGTLRDRLGLPRPPNRFTSNSMPRLAQV